MNQVPPRDEDVAHEVHAILARRPHAEPRSRSRRPAGRRRARQSGGIIRSRRSQEIGAEIEDRQETGRRRDHERQIDCRLPTSPASCILLVRQPVFRAPAGRGLRRLSCLLRLADRPPFTSTSTSNAACADNSRSPRYDGSPRSCDCSHSWSADCSLREGGSPSVASSIRSATCAR